MFEELVVQLLQRPIFANPDYSGQVEVVNSVFDVNNEFGPFITNSHVGISPWYPLDRWQFRLKFFWNLEEKHDSASLELSKLFDGLLAVENVLHLMLVDPSN